MAETVEKKTGKKKGRNVKAEVKDVKEKNSGEKERAKVEDVKERKTDGKENVNVKARAKDAKVRKVLGILKTARAAAEARPEEKAAKTEKIGRRKKKLVSASENPWSVLKWSKLTEKAIAQVERDNKLVFVVRSGATRDEVKRAIESAFEVKVAKVNVAIDPKGEKKAFVRLKEEFSALDIATKLGMM